MNNTGETYLIQFDYLASFNIWEITRSNNEVEDPVSVSDSDERFKPHIFLELVRNSY